MENLGLSQWPVASSDHFMLFLWCQCSQLPLLKWYIQNIIYIQETFGISSLHLMKISLHNMFPSTQWTGSIESDIFSTWTPNQLSPCRCNRAVHPRIAKQASHGAQLWSRMEVLHDGKETTEICVSKILCQHPSLKRCLSWALVEISETIDSLLHMYHVFSSSWGSPDLSFSDPELVVVQSDCDPGYYLCFVPSFFMDVWRNIRNLLIIFVGNYAQLRVLNLVRLKRVLIKNLFKGWLFGALAS